MERVRCARRSYATLYSVYISCRPENHLYALETIWLTMNTHAPGCRFQFDLLEQHTRAWETRKGKQKLHCSSTIIYHSSPWTVQPRRVCEDKEKLTRLEGRETRRRYICQSKGFQIYISQPGWVWDYFRLLPLWNVLPFYLDDYEVLSVSVTVTFGSPLHVVRLYYTPAYDELWSTISALFECLFSRAIFCKQLIYVYVKINPANAQRRAKGQVASNVKRSTQPLN